MLRWTIARGGDPRREGLWPHGARKVMRHCIPCIALRSWRPPGRMLRRTITRGGDPRREGLWPDGARKSDTALHPMHCVNGAAIPIRLALPGARCGLCEPLVSPFAPRKNESFAERKATNFAKAISDDPFESAGVVGEATALLGTKIKAGNFLVKVQEVRLKQEAAARNAMEATERAMEEYRAQFAGQAAACAGSAHGGEAPGVEGRAGTEGVGAEIEADTAAVAEESRGVDRGWPAKAGTSTSRAVAEESRGVDQRRPAKAGTPTSRAVAEESRGVDQRRPAKAGTPTSGTVAEELRGVDQRRPAKAGTPTSAAVAEESRGVDQRRPAQAGTPTSRAVAEEREGVEQNGGAPRIADEEKKMGEKKIPCVDRKGGAPRSAEPTPNGPLRNLHQIAPSSFGPDAEASAV